MFLSRKSRIKCDETRPICTYCRVRFLNCQYALDPSPATMALKSILLQQPSSSSYPNGISPTGSEIDMFGIFRSETVHNICGTFNKSFWLEDVPKAAQTYPALWHASLALAAIHQNEKVKKTGNLISQTQSQSQSPSLEPDVVKRNYYYIFALTHFSQSITYLRDTIRKATSISTDDKLSYQDQEMLIITNLLYIGICNMLGDSTQAILHLKNLFSFIEHVRFGEDANTDPDPRGMLNFKDLLSILLFIDSITIDHSEIKRRFARSYAIPVPQYPSFASMRDVYVSFQLIRSNCLQDAALWKLPPEMTTLILAKTNTSFLQRLSVFENSTTLTHGERQDIEFIRLFMKYAETRSKIEMSKSIAERIGNDSCMDNLLDQIESFLQEQEMLMGTRDLSSIAFCPNLITLVGSIASTCRVRPVYEKALGMLKRWPYKQSATDNDKDYILYMVKATFEVSGPTRSLAAQQNGYPVEIRYPESRDIDPCEGCECVPDLFVCRDHLLGDHRILTEDGKLLITFWSKHDCRNGFEGQNFTFDL